MGILTIGRERFIKKVKNILKYTDNTEK